MWAVINVSLNNYSSGPKVAVSLRKNISANTNEIFSSKKTDFVIFGIFHILPTFPIFSPRHLLFNIFGSYFTKNSYDGCVFFRNIGKQNFGPEIFPRGFSMVLNLMVQKLSKSVQVSKSYENLSNQLRENSGRPSNILF